MSKDSRTSTIWQPNSPVQKSGNTPTSLQRDHCNKNTASNITAREGVSMPTTHHPLGIDIGGSGIKGAPVDLATGQFAKDRLRCENLRQSTPDAVVDLVVQIAEHFAGDTGDSPIGVTLPAVVTNGVVRTAANIDPASDRKSTRLNSRHANI